MLFVACQCEEAQQTIFALVLVAWRFCVNVIVRSTETARAGKRTAVLTLLSVARAAAIAKELTLKPSRDVGESVIVVVVME